MSKKNKGYNPAANHGNHSKAHMHGKTSNLPNPDRHHFFKSKSENKPLPAQDPAITLALTITAMQTAFGR